MSSSAHPRIPSIKLKLSLSNTTQPPSTPTPTPTPTSQQPISSLKKSKGKQSNQNKSTPVIKLRASKSKPKIDDDEEIDKTDGPFEQVTTTPKVSTPPQSPLPDEQGDDVDNSDDNPSTSSFSRPSGDLPQVATNGNGGGILNIPKPATPIVSRQPKATPKAKSTPKLPKAKITKKKPTAIPARLLSESLPATPAAPIQTSLYSTPASTNGEIPETPEPEVKLEPDISTPMEFATPGTPSRPASPEMQDRNATPVETPGLEEKGAKANKWMRLRRPFRELAQKILTELKKRDDYGLFLEPGQYQACSSLFRRMPYPIDHCCHTQSIQRIILII